MITVREEGRGKRRQQFGVKWLMEVGANQADHVGPGIDQALRHPVDAVTQMIGGAEDAVANLIRDARARREGARNRGARDARASRDVLRRDK